MILDISLRSKYASALCPQNSMKMQLLNILPEDLNKFVSIFFKKAVVLKILTKVRNELKRPKTI